MAYTAFSDEINNKKIIIANTVTALDIYCLSQKQKNPYPRKGRYGFYIFIGRGRFETCPCKHLYYNTFTFFTIEDSVKQLQAGLLAPGSSY